MELPINQILCGDCLELMKTFPEESIDLIITDPPYKADFDYLWKPLGEHAFRLLKNGGSLLTLCGHYQLPKVMKDLLDSKLQYYWCCAIWNHQEPYIFKNQLKVTWKPLLWFTKGKIPKHKTLADGVKPSGADKRYHKWGQAQNFLHHYIKALTTENMVILDPFVGGGTTVKVCHDLGRKWIGIDNDPKSCAITRKRLKAMPQKLPLFYAVNLDYAKGESMAKSLTDIRFEVVIAMINNDPKLAERLKVYLGK